MKQLAFSSSNEEYLTLILDFQSFYYYFTTFKNKLINP